MVHSFMRHTHGRYRVFFLNRQLTGNVIDGLLVFFHAGNVFCEGGGFIARLRTVVAQQLRQLLAVLRVLVDSQLPTKYCTY